MKAERLLTHYEQIADAPDAVARLRRFVLDLAVSGQLVPQDDEWNCVRIDRCLEPLSDGRHIHQGWSPQCEKHPSPNNDVWAVLKTTAIQDGYFLEDQNKELPKRFDPRPVLEVSPGDILITCAGPRARCGIACLVRKTRQRLMISGKMYRFRAAEAIISREYLELFLRSDKAQQAINLMKTGSSESGLNLTHYRFRALEVRFGSLSEQRRIVAKVDKLMNLCDRLEAARADREAVRDRLAAASLARLSAPDAETFAVDARFALDALPALTTRPDQIKALRQTILSLAVRGRLVPQDETDEPASELLTRIAREKARLVKDRVVRSRDIQPPIGLGEVPFDLPNSWVWTRLGTLCFLITDGAHHTPRYQEEGVPFLSVKDVSGGRIDLANTRFISKEAHRGLARRCNPEFGDILLTKVGTTGIAVEVETDQEFSIFVSLALLKFSHDNIDRRFLCHLINSPFVRRQSADNTQGIGNKNLVLRLINQFAIPLPPLAEQRRIVAKVDALMALCDRLEASLTDTAATRRRLLDALLAEALAPAEGRALEAAE